METPFLSPHYLPWVYLKITWDHQKLLRAPHHPTPFNSEISSAPVLKGSWGWEPRPAHAPVVCFRLDDSRSLKNTSKKKGSLGLCNSKRSPVLSVCLKTFQAQNSNWEILFLQSFESIAPLSFSWMLPDSWFLLWTVFHKRIFQLLLYSETF